MVSIKNLKKSFGQSVILDNVNLEIGKGEALVIIGGSGCGKSTLLRCINRLNEPDSGEILIGGQNILAKSADVDAIRRKMGMVYQQFNLFSHLNVIENIILAPMNMLGMDQESAIKEAEALLERVGMLRYKYNMPQTLSGGQKQRVAIARALAMHPDVMLFDEPTSALDPTMVNEVESVIYNLVKDGMTSIIVTHEMRFARRIATHVAFLAEKGVYETGTAAEIFDNPKKTLTRRFLYNNRMYEKRFTLADIDQHQTCEEMVKLLRRYDYTSRQLKSFPAIFDELVYPQLLKPENAGMAVTIRLICSETSTEHIVMVNFEGIDHSPLDGLDELNRKLLSALFRSMDELPGESGREVVLQL